ncbi:MAG: hypothetical protein NT157_01770 [Candidatus Micrarchaeota archaeon]|nr:hypothetical protein [Candidatus Micrarchaeota archaeon]
MPMLVANDKKLSQTEIVALISKLQGNFGSQTALKETIYRLAETGHPFAIAAICQCITDPKCGGLKAEEAWTALVNYPSKRAIANLRDALERGQKLSPPKRGSAEDALEKLESKLKSGNAKAEKPFMKTAASGGKQASAPMEKPLTQEECIKILNSPAETPEAQREQARAVVSLFGSVGPNKKESYTELAVQSINFLLLFTYYFFLRKQFRKRPALFCNVRSCVLQRLAFGI